MCLHVFVLFQVVEVNVVVFSAANSLIIEFWSSLGVPLVDAGGLPRVFACHVNTMIE